MSAHDDLTSELEHTRQRFLALVADVRPDLHRYCARMSGSVVDGEDIVQDTLARAYFALPELESFPELRPWLFAIAHRRAIDHLRRYERRMGEPLELRAELADDELARAEAVQLAVTRFVELPPAQRSAVILKDVLGHSLEEIGALLTLSVPAVKAALHRGRAQLRAVAPAPAAVPPPAHSPALARYAALFNARDWDGVRTMLAEDVRLDVVSRVQRRGRSVGQYTERYSTFYDWYFVPAWLDGREVLAVVESEGRREAKYFIELEWEGTRVRAIRDFRHVPYIACEAALRLGVVATGDHPSP
jgi:RNA polymerase sigma factor (sigma-70 family)